MIKAEWLFAVPERGNKIMNLLYHQYTLINEIQKLTQNIFKYTSYSHHNVSEPD